MGQMEKICYVLFLGEVRLRQFQIFINFRYKNQHCISPLRNNVDSSFNLGICKINQTCDPKVNFQKG